jgi:hypothetical protein
MVSGGPTPVKRATATAFGEGRTTVAMVLVGEQPGDQEDKQGRPLAMANGDDFHRGGCEVDMVPVWERLDWCRHRRGGVAAEPTEAGLS